MSLSVASLGEDRGRGNLLGIQARMEPFDFRSRINYLAPLNQWLTDARSVGLIGPKTIVVLPEYIGFFLYLADEWPWVYRSDTLEQAGIKAVLDEKIWITLLGLKYPSGKRMQGVQAELLRLKAQSALDHWSFAMAHLAQSHAVTVVGGSIPLPATPTVVDGRIELEPKSHPWRGMVGVSGVWLPSGEMAGPLTIKRHPTSQEHQQLWMAPQPDGPLPVHETPAGRLGVLICADSWYPDAWQALDRPDFVAVPGFIPGWNAWQGAWGGYDAAPGDQAVVPATEQITEREAWMRHTLPTQIQQTTARAGVTTFLRGPLWDLGTSGQPIIHLEGRSRVLDDLESPGLANVWL